MYELPFKNMFSWYNPKFILTLIHYIMKKSLDTDSTGMHKEANCCLIACDGYCKKILNNLKMMNVELVPNNIYMLGYMK